MNKINEILQNFETISLSEMDSVKLMNRADTKFVFHKSQLEKILPKIQNYYKVLEVKNNKISTYQTLYFDTNDFKFYYNHHNGKSNRCKIRMRKYVESDLNFLEVKKKNNKKKTNKTRILIDNISPQIEEKHKEFINKSTGIDYQLNESHWNSFQRITLVSKQQLERLTIDINLSFYDKNEKQELNNVVIAEVKQEKKSRSSDFIKLLKYEYIYPLRISKYCIATATLNKYLKRNIFKRKFLQLKKIMNHD